jgi:hypothetical protein
MAPDDLPELIGTPKQVAYATGVRAHILAMLQRADRQLPEVIGQHFNPPSAQMQADLDRRAALFASIRKHADATYWLDRRGDNVNLLMRREAEHLHELEAQAQRDLAERDQTPGVVEPKPLDWDQYERPPRGHTTH